MTMLGRTWKYKNNKIYSANQGENFENDIQRYLLNYSDYSKGHLSTYDKIQAIE